MTPPTEPPPASSALAIPQSASSRGDFLVLNGGSSSLKFAVFESDSLQLKFSGKIDRIGSPQAVASFLETGREPNPILPFTGQGVEARLQFITSYLEKNSSGRPLRAIGHRVVHGGPNLIQPRRITSPVIEELQRLCPFAPEHLPGELELITAAQHQFPTLPQIACFDTAFHQSMPRVAKILPIPRRYEAVGIRRYGFHGLSYEYLMTEVLRLEGSSASRARILLAHLGNGASLAAVHEGRCLDTTMGFSPSGGLVMGSRTGDLDPGVIVYLGRSESKTPDQLYDLVNKNSGLLGVSETNSDMRQLLKIESHDPRAAEAIAVFCYQAKKWVGAFAAVLGGLDLLVFSGGIGENNPVIRERICGGLEFLGLKLDRVRNETNAGVISNAGSRVRVRVIQTNEELMIATAMQRVLE